jgi:hypothetical protein
MICAFPCKPHSFRILVFFNITESEVNLRNMVNSRVFSNAVCRSDLRLIALLLLPIVLSACGGSGSANSGLTWPIDQVMITQPNATQVAGAAFDALTGGIPLAASPPPLSTSGATAVSMSQKLDWLGQSAMQLLNPPLKPYPKAITSNCTVSGTLSANIKNSSSEVVTYNNCSNVAGETINGTLRLSGLTRSATYNSADLLFDLTFTIASPADTMNVIGNMNIALDSSADVAVISGTDLWMGNSDAALGNYELLNYTMATYAADVYVTRVYTFASSAIGGKADFQMDGTNPFVNTGGIFPSSGIATISGANSTVIRVTILGDETAAGNQLQFELSTDGGTSYAVPFYDTWANISKLI